MIDKLQVIERYMPSQDVGFDRTRFGYVRVTLQVLDTLLGKVRWTTCIDGMNPIVDTNIASVGVYVSGNWIYRSDYKGMDMIVSRRVPLDTPIILLMYRKALCLTMAGK